MRIHHLLSALRQVSVGLLIADKPLDSSQYGVLVRSLGFVRLSCGEEGQEAHCRPTGIAGRELADPCARFVLALLNVVRQAPMPVGVILMMGQPEQRGGDSSLGMFSSATSGQHFLPAPAAAPAKA